MASSSPIFELKIKQSVFELPAPRSSWTVGDKSQQRMSWLDTWLPPTFYSPSYVRRQVLGSDAPYVTYAGCFFRETWNPKVLYPNSYIMVVSIGWFPNLYMYRKWLYIYVYIRKWINSISLRISSKTFWNIWASHPRFTQKYGKKNMTSINASTPSRMGISILSV